MSNESLEPQQAPHEQSISKSEGVPQSNHAALLSNIPRPVRRMLALSGSLAALAGGVEAGSSLGSTARADGPGVNFAVAIGEDAQQPGNEVLNETNNGTSCVLTETAYSRDGAPIQSGSSVVYAGVTRSTSWPPYVEGEDVTINFYNCGDQNEATPIAPPFRFRFHKGYSGTYDTSPTSTTPTTTETTSTTPPPTNTSTTPTTPQPDPNSLPLVGFIVGGRTKIKRGYDPHHIRGHQTWEFAGRNIARERLILSHFSKGLVLDGYSVSYHWHRANHLPPLTFKAHQDDEGTEVVHSRITYNVQASRRAKIGSKLCYLMDLQGLSDQGAIVAEKSKTVCLKVTR